MRLVAWDLIDLLDVVIQELLVSLLLGVNVLEKVQQFPHVGVLSSQRGLLEDLEGLAQVLQCRLQVTLPRVDSTDVEERLAYFEVIRW